MKRTTITIKTIDSDNKIKSQNRITLKEAEGYRGHGTVEIKMKDFVPVDASLPINKLTIDKIPVSAYLKPENSNNENKS